MDLVRLELTPPTLQGWRSPIELQARSCHEHRLGFGASDSGSDGRTRTFNLLLNREALYRLSYIGMWLYPREDLNLHRPG